jgi:hypothetical protein
MRLKKSIYFALLLLAPWFFCSALGQIWIQSHEAHSGLKRWKQNAADFFPPSGGTIYVLPSELMPYYRENLSEYSARRIEEIAFVSDDVEDVLVLDLNCWKQLQPLRDFLILHMINKGDLSASLETKETPGLAKIFRNYRLKGFKHDAARRLLDRGIRPASKNIPETATAWALPKDQKPSDGWSLPEIDEHNSVFRWAVGGASLIKFNKPPRKGKYVLYFEGYRTNYPEDPVDMVFSFLHEKDIYPHKQKAGFFHIQIPVVLRENHPELILKVDHPVWRPLDFQKDTEDSRRLMFLFLRAWLEPHGN